MKLLKEEDIVVEVTEKKRKKGRKNKDTDSKDSKEVQFNIWHLFYLLCWFLLSMGW